MRLTYLVGWLCEMDLLGRLVLSMRLDFLGRQITPHEFCSLAPWFDYLSNDLPSLYAHSCMLVDLATDKVCYFQKKGSNNPQVRFKALVAFP